MKTDKKHLIFSIILVLAAFAFYKVSAVLMDKCNMNYYIENIAKEVLFFVAAFVAAIVLKKTDALQWKKKGWGSGLLVGLYLIIMAVLNIALGIGSIWLMDLTPTISAMEGLSLLLFVILVGMAEELLFRGVLQNCFHDFFGEDSVAAVRKAIVCTGLVFGCLHIFNVFSGASFSGALIQAIAAFSTGMFFAAIYYRSHRNLWVCIFIHAFYDAAAFITGGSLMGVKATDSISNYGINNLAGVAIELVIVLFVMRKKKLEQCIVTE